MGLRKFTHSSWQECAELAAAIAPADLQQALQSADPQQRRAAIWQIQPSVQSTDLLLAHVMLERQEPVLEAVLVALARSQDGRIVGPLLQLLSSEDAWLRNRVLEVLADYPHQVLEQVQQQFPHVDADTRIFMVNLMTDLRHLQVLPWLLQVLQQETHVNVVAAALEVVAEIGDASAAPVLEQVQQRFSHEPFMAFAVQLTQQRIEVA